MESVSESGEEGEDFNVQMEHSFGLDKSLASDCIEIKAYRHRYIESDDFFYDGNLSRVGTIVCLPCQELQENSEIGRGEKYSSMSPFHENSLMCATCGGIFNTARLLDLHLTENHDTYFAAKLERESKKDVTEQEPLFECIVELCLHRSLSNKKRNKHLVESHSFPLEYDFNKVYQRNRGDAKNKKKRKKKKEDVKQDGNQMDFDEIIKDFGRLEVKVPLNLSFGGRGRGRGRGRAGLGGGMKSDKEKTSHGTKIGIDRHNMNVDR